MSDGNNVKERVAPEKLADAVLDGAVQIAVNVSQGAEKVSSAIADRVSRFKDEVTEKLVKAVEEQAKTAEKSNRVEVETTDKILNGAMNNSRFDIKVSLAEGILNGLFCGSLLTVNIYNYGSTQQPTAPEVAKTEEV